MRSTFFIRVKRLFPDLAFLAGLIFFQNLLPLNALGRDAASQETVFKHETGVILKLIQVVVTDKKGNPVTDIKKEEFTYLFKLSLPKIDPGSYTLSLTAKTESGKISSIYSEIIID